MLISSFKYHSNSKFRFQWDIQGSLILSNTQLSNIFSFEFFFVFSVQNNFVTVDKCKVWGYMRSLRILHVIVLVIVDSYLWCYFTLAAGTGWAPWRYFRATGPGTMSHQPGGMRWAARVEPCSAPARVVRWCSLLPQSAMQNSYQPLTLVHIHKMF